MPRIPRPAVRLGGPCGRYFRLAAVGLLLFAAGLCLAPAERDGRRRRGRRDGGGSSRGGSAGLAGFRREEAGQPSAAGCGLLRGTRSRTISAANASPCAVGGGSALDQQLEVRVADSTSSYEPGPMQSLLNQALAAIRAEFEPLTWQAFLLTALQGRVAGRNGRGTANVPGRGAAGKVQSRAATLAPGTGRCKPVR